MCALFGRRVCVSAAFAGGGGGGGGGAGTARAASSLAALYMAPASAPDGVPTHLFGLRAAQIGRTAPLVWWRERFERTDGEVVRGGASGAYPKGVDRAGYPINAAKVRTATPAEKTCTALV